MSIFLQPAQLAHQDAAHDSHDPLAAAMNIGRAAAHALVLELETWPKPGLVSHIDNGAHDDMNAALLRASAATLEPYFMELAMAGAANATMTQLRQIGLRAEAAMFAATGGVNTHRGALFSVGMLAAAAGWRAQHGEGHQLGAVIVERWGRDILDGPVDTQSHGSAVARRYGAEGARGEVAAGLPSLYDLALPALRQGRELSGGDAQAARIHACMTLIANVEDTNLLYRGGAAGLMFAQHAAQGFLRAGSVSAADWQLRAQHMHQQFIAQRLSPGGSADLLAMALFVEQVSP